MKLILPVPPDWEQRVVEDGILYQAPSQIFGMLVTPMGAAQPDPESWIRLAFLYRAKEDDGEPRDLTLSRFATADGWGVIVVDGVLGTQARFVAYLAFLDYACTVIGMCRDAQQQSTWRDEVLALVAQAHPDFTEDRVVCLADQLGSQPPPTVNRRRRAMAGWHRSFAGGDLVLTGEGGAPAGLIRVASHVTPVRTVREIFSSFVPATPDITVDAPSLEITDEGEYAVIATATSPTAQHILGVVFADDHYTRIEAVVRDRDQFARFGAAVRELTYATTLGLGAGRWRRFYYEPPSEWTGIARNRGALWISPACPRHHQVMRVFDARPPADHELLHGARMFETLPIEFYREQPKGPVSYWTADDLECQVTVYTAQLPNRIGKLAVLDGIIMTTDYVYPIRMECDPVLFEDSMHTFEQVVASFRPVPERRNVDLDAGTAVEFWAD